MAEGDLYINGQQIDPHEILNDSLDENQVLINLPNHLVIDRNNCDRWLGDIDDSDAEKLGEILRTDTDKYINKKIKILIQIVGNKSSR